MGLDMYLYKKTYVKQWEHIKDDKQFHVTVKRGKTPYTAIKKERVCYITEEVGYWRKFNALHQWFVENCQDGIDDCSKESYVSKEQIEEILDILKQINEDHSLAEELLPSQDGFFFGNTDYDEYYFQDVENTIKLISELLEEDDDGEFYYKSSW